MIPEPFDQDDLPLINRILEQHPEIGEVLAVVKQITGKARFPITDFDELTQALGGEDTFVPFRGQPLSVGELRNWIPAYYFPISSEMDLIAKFSDLRSQASEVLPPLEAVEVGEQIPMPEGLRPPDLPDPPRPEEPGGIGFFGSE